MIPKPVTINNQGLDIHPIGGRKSNNETSLAPHIEGLSRKQILEVLGHKTDDLISVTFANDVPENFRKVSSYLADVVTKDGRTFAVINTNAVPQEGALNIFDRTASFLAELTVEESTAFVVEWCKAAIEPSQKSRYEAALKRARLTDHDLNIALLARYQDEGVDDASIDKKRAQIMSELHTEFTNRKAALSID